MENTNVHKRSVSRSGRSTRKNSNVAPNTPSVKTPALVLIEWLDAEHEFGWMESNEIDDKEEVLNCWTVGWLLKETKTQVKVCQTFSLDNHAQTLTIPKGMIIHTTVLQQPIARYAESQSK